MSGWDDAVLATAAILGAQSEARQIIESASASVQETFPTLFSEGA